VHDKTGEYHEAEPGYQEPKKPVYYQVRRKDSLWKIASYDFVYGNPYLWKILYEANKNNFINNKNPDLIEIGQVLIIPSLKGETRNGTRDIE
jgi:nucleoid-associated protein YgaU